MQPMYINDFILKGNCNGSGFQVFGRYQTQPVITKHNSRPALTIKADIQNIISRSISKSSYNCLHSSNINNNMHKNPAGVLVRIKQFVYKQIPAIPPCFAFLIFKKTRKLYYEAHYSHPNGKKIGN